MSLSGTAVKLGLLARRSNENDAAICSEAAERIERLYAEVDQKDDEIERLRAVLLTIDRMCYQGDPVKEAARMALSNGQV